MARKSGSCRAWKPTCSSRREKIPYEKNNQVMHANKGTHGGRRRGAGRPAGSRNKPRLLAGLPVTDDALLWLLALMNDDAAPMRLRVNAAVTLLPYCRAQYSRPLIPTNPA